MSTEKERQGGDFPQPLLEWKSRGTCLPFPLSCTGRLDKAQVLCTLAPLSLLPYLEGSRCLQISGFPPGPYQLPFARVLCCLLEEVTRPHSLRLSVHCARAGPSHGWLPSAVLRGAKRTPTSTQRRGRKNLKHLRLGSKGAPPSPLPDTFCLPSPVLHLVRGCESEF